MAAPIDLSASASLEQQAYEIGLALVQAELAVSEENRPDNAQITFDTEAATVDIAITLGTVLSTSNGNAVIGVQTYLV